jgi:DNA polymerase III subunit gamma/tau
MSYVVLARKWRPQTFADLTGQQHVAQTLGNAIHQERVPHALLFTGARGVGKTSSARILAMALNCAKGPTVSPCGVCDACVEIQKGANVDVLEIDGASNRGINEIRELRDGVRYAPNRDRYKVYIIDEVHMLTTEAFNALLKTLEEPPRHVVFILATTEVHKIPVTILSRCQRFDFRRIAHGEIVERLAWIAEQEKLTIERSVLGMIARQAQGGMRDALSLMDQVIAFAGTTVTAEVAAGILGASERKRLFELSAAVIDRNVDHALGVVDNIAAFGVNMQHFASEFLEHLRDLTVIAASQGRSQLTALTDDELELARLQVARSDAATLHRMFELMMETTEAVARSNHARLVLDMGVVRLASLEPMSSVQSVIDRLHAIARGETLPPMAAPPASLPPSSSAPPGSWPPATTASSATPAPIQAAAVALPAVPAVSESVESAVDRVPVSAAEHDNTIPSETDETAEGGPTLDASVPAAAESPIASTHETATASLSPVPSKAAGVASRIPAAEPEPPASQPVDDAPLAAEADEISAPLADAARNGEPATPKAEAAVMESAPEPARTAALPLASEYLATSVPADGATFATVVERWKEMLDQIAEERPNVYGLLQDITVLPATAETAGAIRLAAAQQLMGRLTSEVMELLQSTVDLYLGQRLAFVVIDANHVPLSEIAQGFHLALHEQRVREQREEEIRIHVTEHPATRLILTRWPGSRIRDIRFVDGFEEKSL